ncbi:hypothetical protein [uncultured Lutibacter sp.]|uniref:hypothetical protein n=1 Tax=uncultured Lutibacter sp. TaxID=437739 RepID=UPI0026248864|nr:hypothetical protein [uncultured Lutibacter sp.]
MKTKKVSSFEIYKSYIPELEHKTYTILKHHGMLGKLFRGEEIKLISKDIFIEDCWWRQETFNQSNQYVPCVLKEINPYWK